MNEYFLLQKRAINELARQGKISYDTVDLLINKLDAQSSLIGPLGKVGQIFSRITEMDRIILEEIKL